MTACPSCGTATRPGAPFCVECGTGLEAAGGQATVPVAAAAPTEVVAPPDPPAPAGGGGRPVLTVLAVVLALVAVGVAAFVIGSQAGDDDEAAATTTISTTSTSAPTTETTASTTEAGLDPVDQLPAGLSCQELADRGYSYSAAVSYWQEQGQPDALDADTNGIPCETRYPADVVTAYWDAH